MGRDILPPQETDDLGEVSGKKPSPPFGELGSSRAKVLGQGQSRFRWRVVSRDAGPLGGSDLYGHEESPRYTQRSHASPRAPSPLDFAPRRAPRGPDSPAAADLAAARDDRRRRAAPDAQPGPRRPQPPAAARARAPAPLPPRAPAVRAPPAAPRAPARGCDSRGRAAAPAPRPPRGEGGRRRGSGRAGGGRGSGQGPRGAEDAWAFLVGRAPLASPAFSVTFNFQQVVFYLRSVRR